MESSIAMSMIGSLTARRGLPNMMGSDHGVRRKSKLYVNRHDPLIFGSWRGSPTLAFYAMRISKPISWKIAAAGVTLLLASIVFVPWKVNVFHTFSWQQRLPEPNDLAGWRLYLSTAPGGHYRLLQMVPFVSKQAEYQASVKINFPVQRTERLYIVIAAFDTSGDESAPSNEVSIDLDGGTLLFDYDFVWARKKHMTIHWSRAFAQLAVILIGTGSAIYFTSRRKSSRRKFTQHEELRDKTFYCETCKKELTRNESADVHRAFKHEVRESSG